jgi:dsRNA-specific ribonuclease
MVDHPYNPVNVEITDQEICGLLSQFGIEMAPFNPKLYKRAFIHDSYTYECNPQITVDCVDRLHTKSNQRLECLGDGVLETIAKFYIYKRFPKADEGFIKIEMVKNETIGKLALKMGLARWYIVSKTEEARGIRTDVKKLGCLFESIVGAIFLDYSRMGVSEPGWTDQLFRCGPGFQIAQIFVENVFDQFTDWTAVLTQSENYKRPLQEIMQCEFKVTPEFDFCDETGKTTKLDGYNMGVYMCVGTELPPRRFNSVAAAKQTVENTAASIDHRALPISTFKSFADIHIHLAKYGKVVIRFGVGTHKKKQNAEQFACKSAIEYIKEHFTDFKATIEKTRQKYTATA